MFGMSNLPVTRDRSKLTREEKFSQAIGLALANGHEIPDIVKALVPKRKYKDNPAELKRARNRMRAKIHRMAATDETVRLIVAEHVTGKMVSALPQITDALIKRAKRGRPDAIKLIFEATGYYNPKVKHEHSGDITIKLDIPRPIPVDNKMEGQDPVDADAEDITDADTVD